MKNWKKQTGIWIDSSEAVILTFFDGRENIIKIKSGKDTTIDKNAENHGVCSFSRQFHNKMNEYETNQFNHFLADVVSEIKESDEVYIFGPSGTVSELEEKIYHEKAKDAHVFKSFQQTSKMSLNQILENVREFYKN